MSTILLEGHVVDVLASLPAGHFHTVVTSPPYWQLRYYGSEPQMWGAADGCDHSWGDERTHQRGGLVQHPDMVRGEVHRAGRSFSQIMRMGAFCQHCGAWRGELGQEPDPELYVAHLVAVFSAVRRVLRDDGSLWINLAGSYWSEPGGQNGTGQSTLTGANTKHHALRSISEKAKEANRENGRQKRAAHPVYKGLDWVDVPGLFARAMQAAGWLWRSDVTWIKPSALPESVQGTRWERCRTKTAPGRKAPAGQYLAEAAASPQGVWEPGGMAGQAEWADCPGCPRCEKQDGLVLRRGSGRPTKATERVLLFSKRQGYYLDMEAVREPHQDVHRPDGYKGADGINRPEWAPDEKDGVARGPFRTTHRDYHPAGRNLRDYWILGPEPLKDAHYAAFPAALPERCIRAGTSEWGCCPGCGAPWARVISRAPGAMEAVDRPKHLQSDRSTLSLSGHAGVGWQERGSETTTLGWRPTCRCEPQQPPVPCRVLDPFGGSGTTALAANRLGRDCTLVELKPQYAALARKRVGREPLSLFASHGEQAHGDTGGILPVEEAEGAVAGG